VGLRRRFCLLVSGFLQGRWASLLVEHCFRRALRRPCGAALPADQRLGKNLQKRLKKKANIDHIRFHDLRHEAISRLFEKGLTVPEVASISGHKTPAMLFRYAHADLRRISELISE
jgi:integrase